MRISADVWRQVGDRTRVSPALAARVGITHWWRCLGGIVRGTAAPDEAGIAWQGDVAVIPPGTDPAPAWGRGCIGVAVGVPTARPDVLGAWWMFGDSVGFGGVSGNVPENQALIAAIEAAI